MTVSCGWSVVHSDGVAVLLIRGEIDMAAEVSLTAAAEAMLARSPLHCDLSAVTFIDSSGTRIFLELRKRHESRFVVCAASEPVLRVFELSGVTDHLMGLSDIRTGRAGAVKRGNLPAAVLRLPATPESVTTARHWLTGVLVGWSVERFTIGDAELVFSELVTNAIRHGDGEIECRVAINGQSHCRVSVADAGAGRPCMRPSQLDDPGGRGLQIIDRLADSWGVTDTPGGKSVWAIVAS